MSVKLGHFTMKTGKSIWNIILENSNNYHLITVLLTHHGLTAHRHAVPYSDQTKPCYIDVIKKKGLADIPISQV